MKNPHVMASVGFLHMILIIGLLVFITWKVNWAVGLVLAWMSFSLSKFATGMNRWRTEHRSAVEALEATQQATDANLNNLINNLNYQATQFQNSLKAADNICGECSRHGHMGIRPGSAHNRAADNCLLKNNPAAS